MAVVNQSKALCGIKVASSSAAATDEAVRDIQKALEGGNYQYILVLFSVEHNAQVLAFALANAFGDIPTSGCSTAGEIGPSGMMQGSLLAIAFPAQGFRVRCEAIRNIDRLSVESATEIVRRMKNHFVCDPPHSLAERVFALMLVDGLSNSEEAIVAAVHWALDDIQLVGGSAGDGLSFTETALIHDGEILTRTALLFMIESSFPFRVFKTQNFEPTSIKLVVTGADTENRIVTELNAEPAAREYASAIGLQPDDLGPFSFASYPLVVKIGGDYYCRSIRNMNPDGSLSFFCAIDEGLVFTVARPEDIVNSTAATLEKLERDLGGVDMVLGFDCILRRLDAEASQVRHLMDDVYRRYGVVGFHTYGEQYNAMHLNQTLTGIAFGRAKDGSDGLI